MTNVLFIGGLPPATTADDVLAVLAPHGALDCAAVRVPHGRSYAFALFRDATSARAAVASAQGAPITGGGGGGGTLRTEIARPAKAVKNLWIAGIGPAVTKEDLEYEFAKFGKIEDLRFFRSRNSAMIDFFTLEDAISAHKNMNGRVLKGEQLCVDFQRAQPSRRDSSDTSLNSRGRAPSDNFTDSHQRPKRNSSRSEGRKPKEGGPSSVLWIGYPPNYPKIDEQKLHNAMILFGEIERIKCFPLRKYAFVEFRSTDEARRAKEGLQGRLFNDPKIRILFSHSGSKTDPLGQDEWGPSHDGLLPAPRRVDFDYLDEERERERKRARREREGYFEERERSFSPGFYRGEREDFDRWRGALLKGGSFVCNARCVPIGRGIDLPLLPQAINCSARTDLETLARHYHDSSGFDAVYFLPDSEADFASYTEFLQYLCLKNRAGVAKLSDGSTTLFLVPPSEFLTDILAIRGPERLYGIVLHLPEPGSSPDPRPGSVDPVRHRPGSVGPVRLGLGSVDPVRHGLGSVDPVRHGMGSVDQVRHGPGSVDREGGAVSLPLPAELISSLASIIPAITGAGSTSNANLNNVSGNSFGQGQGTQFPTNGGLPGGYEPYGSAQFPTNVGPPGGYEPHGSAQFQTNVGPPGGYEPHGSSHFPSNVGPPGGYEPHVSSHFPTNVGPPGGYEPHGSSQFPTNVGPPGGYEPHVSSQFPISGGPRGGYEPQSSSYMMKKDPYQYDPAGPSMSSGYSMNYQTHEPVSYQNPYESINTAYQPSMGPVGTGTSTSTGTGFTEQQDVDKNQRYQSTLQFAANLLLQIQQKQQQQRQQGP